MIEPKDFGKAVIISRETRDADLRDCNLKDTPSYKDRFCHFTILYSYLISCQESEKMLNQ